ncbi:MAG: tetratricopeptide repeat protein, partial [Planctomycetes bacterium]|nr:tetratricopeptide repeat protein [Planctomycetota bacterium]
LLEQAVARWEESRRLLTEYIERYPNSSEFSEVRFLLARAFQESAVLTRHRLKEAEVENVRLELRREMHGLINQSREEFRRLQTQLLREEGADLLDGLGQRFLRDCYFEIANNYYALDQFDKSIIAYTSAANRYPQDPQVLIAYLQMANCYDRLDEPGEALSMLVQAKVILKQLPESAFHHRKTNLTKKEWETWLDWARVMRRTEFSQQ